MANKPLISKEMYNKYLPAMSLLLICVVAISAIAAALVQVNRGPVAPTAPTSQPAAAITYPDCFYSFDVAALSIDLHLYKDVNNPAPDVGQQITYTIRLVNEGVDTATGVVVRDTWPTSGLTFVSANASQGTFDSNTMTWNVGTVQVGQANEKTLTIVATVTGPGQINNYAQVTAANETDVDSTPNNGPQVDEDDDENVPINSTLRQIDLELQKSVSNSTPALNSNITYLVTVTNQGNLAATGVTVEDVLPQGLTYVSSNPQKGTYSNTTSIWTVGNMGIGEIATLQIVARVTSASTITNYAQVESAVEPDPDSTPGNGPQTNDEDDDAQVPINPVGPTATSVPNTEADLSLTKRVSNITPRVGENITYTIQVHNAGPVRATNVTVKEPLADGLTFVSATPSRGTYDSNTDIWTIGALDVNEIVKLDIVVTVNRAGQIINTAQVQNSDQKDPDSTPGNNIPSEDDQQSVALNPTEPGADLSLTKRVSNSRPTVGQDIIFTVEVHNGGPNEANGVRVKDLLPAGIRFKSAVPNQGSYNTTDGIWTIGTMPVNSVMRIDITGTVTQSGQQTNIAEVFSSDQRDPDSSPNNNIASEDDQDDAMIESAGAPVLPRSGNASRTTLYVLAAGVVVLITGAMGLLLLL